MRILTVIITAIVISACNNQTLLNKPTAPAAKELTIEGNVKNLPDGKLYLTEAHYWHTALDSTEVKNGHFTFRYKIDSSFVPFMGKILFHDSTAPSKLGVLVYRNHMMKGDSLKYGLDAFMVEKGNTRIEGEYKSKPDLRVFAGRQTDVMYKNNFTGFGWLGNVDSAKRMQRIAVFKKEIKANPFSYFLLLELLNVKFQYSEADLAELLCLFDADVQHSKTGAEVRTYLANRTDPGKPNTNILLLNAHNEKHYILDKDSKLNMLVFWASWCGPCRKEIPALKEIYSKYKDKAFHMASISIDENKDQWRNALEQEKMDWPQYVTDSARQQLVMQQFNFAAIPLIVFTDGNGIEIKRFTGYEPGNKKLFIQTIDSILNKQ